MRNHPESHLTRTSLGSDRIELTRTPLISTRASQSVEISTVVKLPGIPSTSRKSAGPRVRRRDPEVPFESAGDPG